MWSMARGKNARQETPLPGVCTLYYTRKELLCIGVKNINGVGGICTAAGYAEEAFNALEEGQYVLIAPNGGSAGNTARGLLYGSRAVGVDVVVTIPDGTEPAPEPATQA